MSPGSAWRFAAASVIGTAHIKLGTACQDANDCGTRETAEGQAVFVAVASDGAGSASRGGEGALFACDLFMQEISALLEQGDDVPDVTPEFAQKWLFAFQQAVSDRAEAEGLTPRDFACTLLAAVIGENYAAFLQIGDGVIVISPRDAPPPYQWVFWPERGEYENVTFFATDPAAHEHLQHKMDAWSIDEVALLTDGLQRLALSYETRTAHAPFFGPMFAPLRAAPAGRSDELCDRLTTFLGGRQINERTDDDKTLVLATRVPSPPPPPTEGSTPTVESHADC